MKPGDIVLIHISSRDRIDFVCPSDISEHLSASVKYDFIKRKSWCTILPNMRVEKIKKVLDYYNTFKNEIDFLYMSFEDEIKYLSQRTISYLYTISKLYDIKMIVFCSNHDNYFHRHYKKLYYDNFFVSHWSLFEISYNEILRSEKDDYTSKMRDDKRYNHLSKENHVVMINFLTQILNNSYYNLPRFKEDFVKIRDAYDLETDQENYQNLSVSDDQNDKNLDVFIYD